MTSRPSGPPTVPAAGAVLWRREAGRLQVALVHRPKYDDWSWAKGKLDPGESWPVAAAREVLEETGFRPRLGLPLPSSRYSMARGQHKEIRYWAAEVLSGTGELENEIDQVAWLTPSQAQLRLSYPRDVHQLQAVVEAEHAGRLVTWPLVIVRHADCLSRRVWRRPDPERPLDQAGREQARALVPVLAAYGVERVITSPSARCFGTVQPYAAAAGLQLHTKSGLSEETFEERPRKAFRALARLLDRAEPAAVCTHRPVLPGLLDRLGSIADGPAAALLRDAADAGLGKGDALVCQLTGHGKRARVVSVERQPSH